MKFPVVLHKDSKSDFGVIVPDLPGCFSAGSTVDEALAMAKEAIELHLEGLIRDGMPVPRPGKIERHQRNADYRGGTWAVVTVDPSALRVHAKRQ
jgi:predicted RNase H-like HicB family nuclease